MKLKFKNSNSEYEVKNIIERKAFKGDVSGWLISFMLECDLNAEEIDNLFSEDNISQLTVINADSTRIINGYDKVITLSVHYLLENTLVEVQLSKGL